MAYMGHAQKFLLTNIEDAYYCFKLFNLDIVNIFREQWQTQGFLSRCIMLLQTKLNWPCNTCRRTGHGWVNTDWPVDWFPALVYIVCALYSY